MTNDERLMFHITQGYLRRWSLWNEDICPEWAVGEGVKHQIFQSWRQNPYKEIGKNEDGTPQYQFHPMSDFENWPYWLILELGQYVFKSEPYADLLQEPEQFKEEICNIADAKYSNNEERTSPQAQ